MFTSPYMIKKLRNINVLQLEDTLWAALTDSYTKMPMAITAENLAEQYNISREECDAFALKSQQRWAQGMLFQCSLAKFKK